MATAQDERREVDRMEAPLPMMVVERNTTVDVKKRSTMVELGGMRVGLLGVALMLAGGILLGYGGLPSWRGEVNLPAKSSEGAGRQGVMGLGKVIPWSDVVTVAPPFGAGDARIAKILVQEGEQVEQGAVLAVLDNERVLQAVIAAARTQISAREAGLGQAASSVRSSRVEVQALLARSEVASARASHELNRMESLYGNGASSEQSLDLQRSAKEEAAKEVERVKASLIRFGSGSVYGQADVVAAARQIEVAKAELVKAEAELERAYVRAPIAGTVLSVQGKPGERPGSGVLNIGDLRRMKVEVEVYQTQIGRVRVGNQVECEAEALSFKLHGEVVQVGIEVGRQRLIDMTPAANTDARVVKVVVALDERSTEVAKMFSGLQVTAKILPGGER